jgi:hypothetical protein
MLTNAGKRLHGKKMKGGKTRLMRIQKPLQISQRAERLRVELPPQTAGHDWPNLFA